MAVSKATPRKPAPPAAAAPAAAAPDPAAASGAMKPRPASKVQSGMGDVTSEMVEVWSDADHARATGLDVILDDAGRILDQARVPALSPQQLRDMYRGMLLIRILDERLMTMQRQGRVGFYAEARGHEATVIAPAAALEAEDWIVPSHREGGAALFRGLPLRAYVAQVMGNGNDIGKGRQMPVHPAAPRSLRFLPMSSCVATQLPQAAGIAWAAKLKKDRTAVLAYLGEGATSAEDFHTGVNFAAVFRAPVVFMCVNNGWAVSTPAAAQSASETFAVKALAYGIPGVRVDGNDPLVLLAATREALERARRGDGPTLIEAVTYRLGAHSSSDDPTRYRDAAEVDVWSAREPLLRFRSWLHATGVLDAAGDRAMAQTIEREVREAIEAEEQAPPPPLRTLIEDVYVRPLASLEEQLADLERVRARRRR
jgi:pyruvate dehydrogenase E1 component alpha subunit